MSGPLEGLLVVDLTQVVSGPVTTMLLADLGATVIKVEPPAGEPYRTAGHRIDGENGTTNLNILRWSRGKQSITLDLKSEGGRSVLAGLIEKGDILVENFRPGVMERLGFGRDRLYELNPEIIYASVSGFGHDDFFAAPYRDRPAYAIITEAMAGLTNLAGQEDGKPVWMGFAMADIFGGVLALTGILLALGEREKKHEGGRVDISMYDGALFMNDLAMASYSAIGEVMGPGQYVLQSPWGPFETVDGYVVVAVLVDHQWRALCEVIDRPDLADDERLRIGRDRSAHHEEVVEPAVTAWSRTRTKAECTEILLAAGVPASPVRDAAEVAECPQAAAREMLVDVVDPVAGPLKLVGNPIKTGASQDERSWAIPRLGEHNEAVLKDVLGLDAEAIASLEDEGALDGQRKESTAA
jgi:CoA:oxalate CoA-transferase